MRFKTFIAAGLGALALAAPALADMPGQALSPEIDPAPAQGQALSPEIVPGAGLSGVAGVRAVRYRFVHGLGATASGTFRVDFAAGPGNKVVLVQGTKPVFRALRFTSMRWTDSTVQMRGIGLALGRRVAFTAIAADNARGDVFRVAWGHRAALGGVLTRGSIVIH